MQGEQRPSRRLPKRREQLHATDETGGPIVGADVTIAIWLITREKTGWPRCLAIRRCCRRSPHWRPPRAARETQRQCSLPTVSLLESKENNTVDYRYAYDSSVRTCGPVTFAPPSASGRRCS